MSSSLKRDLLWLFAVAATSTSIHALRPAVSYRTLELGGSAAAVGIVAAAFALPPVLAAIPTGIAVDRIGARRPLIAGTSLLFVSAGLCALAPNLVWLAIAHGLVGLGQVAFVLGVQSIVANRRNRDEGFARLTFAGGIGQLVGPLVAGWLVAAGQDGPGMSGAVLSFLVSSSLAFLGVIFSAVGTRNMPTVTRHQPGKPLESLRSLASSTGLGQALTTSIIMTSSVEMMVVYLPVLGASHDISPATVGAVLGVRAISGLASRVVMLRLQAWLGRGPLLVGALLTAGASIVAMALIPRVLPWFLLSVVIGFGLGLGAPMTMALVAMRAPPDSRAAAMAVRVTGDRAGLMVFAALFGGLASLLGAGVVFYSVAGSLFFGAAWMRISPSALAYEPE